MINPGLRPPLSYLTPPYLMARPDVQVHKIAKNDQFIILATDGLWDLMTNDEAIEHVSEYTKLENANGMNAASYLISKAVSKPLYGPVTDENGEPVSSAKIAAFSLKSKYSRDFRDDISVTVAFFGFVS